MLPRLPRGLLLVVVYNQLGDRFMGNPQKSHHRAQAFYALRMSLGLTAQTVAKLLQVNPQTVRNWELCRHRVPYAAFKLLRVLRRLQAS